MATGVLVVALGEATKLVPYLTADDKSYEATILLGIETDTLDADGKETRRVPVAADLVSRLSAALDVERARTSQVPPAYSAIKIDGRRAHELARKGEAPELAPRDVAVRSLEVTNVHFESTSGHLPPGVAEVAVALEVTKGYFVRSLARDLAAALGTVGHLTALRRTRSGTFTIADAGNELITLDAVAARALPRSTLTDVGVVMAGHGKKIPASEIIDPHSRPSAWLDASGRLVAVGEIDAEGLGRVLRGFPRSET
jgi:tRNA pseudouridine55 synthase